MRKLIYDVGINDYDGTVTETIDGKSVRKPFYRSWCDMLKRCYSEKYHQAHPTYKDCKVHDEWLSLTAFKQWHDEQYVDGYVLDKDLLVSGNKTYSPETCVFLPKLINLFMVENNASRGKYPIGVSFVRCKYIAQINNPDTGKNVHLGSFDAPEMAHEAWKAKKLEYAVMLANQYKDTIGSDAALALITRYATYSE